MDLHSCSRDLAKFLFKFILTLLTVLEAVKPVSRQLQLRKFANSRQINDIQASIIDSDLTSRECAVRCSRMKCSAFNHVVTSDGTHICEVVTYNSNAPKYFVTEHGWSYYSTGKIHVNILNSIPPIDH